MQLTYGYVASNVINGILTGEPAKFTIFSFNVPFLSWNKTIDIGEELCGLLIGLVVNGA